jgi:hypothetical protein
MRLAAVLVAACPEGFEVLPDIEWRLDYHGVVAQAPRPDLAVVSLVDGPVVEPPLLAVEVLSHSDSRRLERHPMSRIEGKYADYGDNGLRYCLEISTDEPAAIMNEYAESAWQTVAWAEDGEELTVTAPFPFSFRPRDLL